MMRLKEEISLFMVAQAREQNGATGKRNACTRRADHLNNEALTKLSPEELTLLDTCEQAIAKHVAAFFEVGSALLRIKEGKLYRAEFKTFEDYCRKRWGMGRFNAYRQIQAAGVMENLLTMVNTPVPENERQIRQLVGLEPQIAQGVWKQAVESAGGKKITSSVVKRAVKGLSSEREVGAHSRETWQDLVEPLLREALTKTRSGKRDEVQDLLYKAMLRLDIGKAKGPPPSENDHFSRYTDT